MLLDIQDLDVSFRNDEGEVTRAAMDVNLTLDRGEVLGIVGESGSGKSSVSMSIARLLPSPPAFYPKGRILLDGQDTLTMPLPELRAIRGKKIGVVFQDPMGSLSPLHRIGDQLVETILLHEKMTKEAARAMALEWLDKVGIPDPIVRARAYPHELSGGMQQRIMIAIALACNPDILIADEPTTALDVTVQAQVLDLLRDLQAEYQMSVILISHNLGVIASLCDEIMVMYGGVVVEEGPTEEIFRDPQHPYTRGLLASIPDITEDKEELYSIRGTVPTFGVPVTRCRFADRCDYAQECCFQKEPELDEAGGRKIRCFRIKDGKLV